MNRHILDPQRILDVVVAAALAFGIALALAACGGPTREAQGALTVTAVALVAADHEVAPRYTAAATEARTQSPSWAAYDAAMEDWNAVEAALRAAHASLLIAQAGLDAWRNGSGEAGWQRAVPCLVVAIDQLRVLLEGQGVHLRPVTEAVALVGAFVGRCEP